MATRIQLRRGTAAQWTAANPVLASGEIGIETNTKRRKTGDGVTAWNSLAYDLDETGADAAVAALLTNPASQTGQAANATEAALQAQIDARVPLASLVPLPALTGGGVAVRRDVLTAALTGENTAVLGADPLPDSTTIHVNGLLVEHTRVGRSLTFVGTAGQTVIVRYAHDPAQTPDPAVIVPVVARDSFDRANSTTGIGTPDVGPAWDGTFTGNAWGIDANKAYKAAGTGAGAAVMDVGIANVVVQVKLDTIAGTAGLMLRATDFSNALITSQTALFRREAGSNTQLGGSFSQTFVAGDTIRAVVSGDAVTIYRQAGSTGPFVEVKSATTTTFNQTATKHGLWSSGDASRLSRWDDWLVTTVA